MGEEEELYNLVNKTIKLRPLKPIPRLPLLHASEIRSKSYYKSLKLSTQSLSRPPSISSVEESVEIFKPKLPKSFYIVKLKEWAEEIPISGLMPSWEANILSLIPKFLKKKYPKCLDSLMAEVKLVYIEEMQEFAVSSIVINDKEEDSEEPEEEPEFIIPTEKPLVTLNNKLFLKNKKKLETNYFLSQSLMKQIISIARQKLTTDFVDFSQFHSLGLLNIADFQQTISRNMRKSISLIKHDYYKEILRKVLTKKHLKKIHKDKEMKFMRCATNLFVQQIHQKMMETVNKMLEIISNPGSCPQLNFKLIITEGIENLDDYEVNISLNPPIEEVCKIYHQVIDDISNIVKDDLLCFKCEDLNETHIQVSLPDWFLKESHEKLSKILDRLFQPLKEHFLKISEEFTYVCVPETRDFILDLVEANEKFELYCGQVKIFNTYLSKTNEMVSYLHYDIGKLNQVSGKANLHKNISDLIQILLDHLINYHWQFNRSIYEEFNALKTKALDIPKNARALFDLSEQISQASAVTVKKLEEKIIKSVKMITELIQITELTEDHIEFNKSTINWLSSIEDVFNQSNSLCESMKSELEDELQRKINVLNAEVEEIIPEFIIMDNMDDASRVHEYIEFLKLLVVKVKAVDEEIQSINLEEKLFKFPETAFPRVDEIKDVILPFYNLNKMIFLWRRHNNVWLDGPFEYIDSAEVEKITLYYFDEFTELNKNLKTKIKLDMSTPNKPFKFSGIIDDPDPMQQPAPLKLCFQVIQHVKDFKQYIRLVNCMCNPALAKRHWNEMSVIYGADITPNAGTTLRKIIALDLMENIEKYEVISISANKELALQKQLDDMAEEWNEVVFDIGEDKGRLVFVNFRDIQVRMEEHLVKVQEMKGSYFVKPIVEDVVGFYQGLMRVRETIDIWNAIQEELITVKPIFKYARNLKLKGQKEEEFEIIFEMSTKIEFCLGSVKNDIIENPTFQGIGKSVEYLAKLKNCREFINTANEKINEHLEKMRRIFPRFFFYSNKEIVNILFNENSEENSTVKVLELLKKCFCGIKSLQLNPENQIVGVFSDYDQEFLLSSVISPENDNWLINTEKSFINSVKENINFGVIENIQNSDDLIRNFLSNIFSISLCVLKINFTSKIEKNLGNHLENSEKSLKFVLDDQISLISSTINALKNNNFNEIVVKKNQRLMLMTLTSVLIHQRDVISLLINRDVVNKEDFNWMAQLRHYYEENQVKLEMIYESKNYGYEFNSSIDFPLINTPLTDRINHTIFQASKHNYFCSLFGPADTGKTEIVKYLAVNELGLQFHLINCTENLTCERVSNVLKGLIACGAFLCFKNFNQAKSSILSAITERFSQVLSILSSKNPKNSDFIDFDGDLLNVKNSGFITVTLTAQPSNYSTFKNIPDNLKSMFRPISVRNSDLEIISEVILSSSGFEKSKIIAKKLKTFYENCSEKLNSQKYSFSLRSLISVLKNSLRLKFQFSDEDNEELIVLRSLIDAYLGILVKNDISMFLRLLDDIFPHSNAFHPNYTNFLNILEESAVRDNFQLPENFKLKIIQILEIVHIRQSFIILGEPLSGKTRILKILANCLSKLSTEENETGIDVSIEVVNHKSIKLENLFGYHEILNKNNKKWVDGICTSILRNFSQKPGNDECNERKWLLFDGPLDSFWTESLTTVLGSRKTLFLDSGEKILVSESTSVIFETETLENATPAIISRCGIVHMELNTIGWKFHVKSWILHQNSYIQPKKNDFIFNLLTWAFELSLNFLKSMNTFFIEISDVFLVISTLKLLKIYLLDAMEINKKEGTDSHFLVHFDLWFQAAVILSIIWAMGGTLSSEESRNKLDEFITSNWSKRPENQPEIPLPEGLIQDHTFIFKGAGVWKSWAEILKNSTEFVDSKFIPSVHTVRLISILESHIRHKAPFILCGEKAIGKTTLMQFLLKKKLIKNNKEYLSNFFNFTSRTTADQAQKFFLLKINRIMKGRYSPPKDKYSINFIDDLNMVNENCTGSDERSSCPLELIRQLIDHGYWFGSCDNEEKFQKIFVENVMFLLSLSSSKRNYDKSTKISRFVRHFSLYNMSAPSKENTFRIFSALLLNNLKRNQFSADVSTSVNSMTHSTIQIYNAILGNEKLRLTPFNNFRYNFNLRDIGRVVNGCSLIHRESAETKVILIRLWAHEILRVFQDRIIEKDQHVWLFDNIKEAITVHFSKESFDSIFDHLPKQNDQLTSESFDSLIFCNFMDSGDLKDEPGRKRRYEEVTCSKETIKTKLIAYLSQLNEKLEESRKLDAIIFSDVITHLIRLSRCLCSPSGNFLMLSIAGGSTGRRVLTKLGSFMQKSEFFELSNDSSWRENLKKAMKIVASTGSDCSFFVPCRYLKEEHLESMNNLISTGEIPDLFVEDEEKQAIIEAARLPAQNGDRNLEIGITDVMNYFYEQCQEKLHFVIYLNLFDVSKNGRNKSYDLLKSYSNILNSCSIDCFEDWPQEAFHQLSTKYLHDLTVINSFMKEKVVLASNDIYEHAKTLKSMNNYKTTAGPYAFLHLMKLYSTIITKKHEKITESRHRYQIGLEKLQYAEQEVSKMKSTLTDLKPQLELSAKQTEETMKEIETENVIVENATIQVKKDEEIANHAAEIAAVLKSECEAELAVAIPILEDAIAALNTLKPTDITLVKAMKNPPDTVKLVMAAVCVMLNVSSDRVIDPVTGKKSMDYWGPSKRILGEMNFLQILKDYDKDNIPPSLMAVIKKTYMTDKSFMPHIVAKASSAAEGLCKWVRAMVSYDEVARIVAPKKEKLAQAEKECNESLDFLNQKRKTLAELTKKLTNLNETLRDTLAKKVQLESEVKSCTEKLAKSEGLIASLDGEKVKWKKSVDLLKSSLETLPGDLLISCGIIAFLSSFDETRRSETIDVWKTLIQEQRISISKNYDFLVSLESKIVIESWRLFGLSKNSFYSQNGVIIKNSDQWCLLIDPQNQANLWIKKMEAKNHIKVFKSSEVRENGFTEEIKNCVDNNYPVLIENLEEDFEPADLDIILNLRNQNDVKDFRLFFTTRTHNPNLNPYILKKANVINFHLPEHALHEQLLDIVVSREQPQLQEKFNELIVKSNLNKQILQQEEKKILTTLSSTSTSVSILEDEKALKVLDTSKKLSVEVRKKEGDTKDAKRDIDGFRECYSDFTMFSASLYHTLTSLAVLNCMYEFSLLGSFTLLFMKSIDTSKRSHVIQRRLEYLKCSFGQTLHNSVKNSLFEDHKTIYSFVLCLKMLSTDKELIKPEEVNYFFANLKANPKNQENQTEELKKLEENFSEFSGICESLKKDENSWKMLLSSKYLKDKDFPVPWNSKLSILQKILLIKILKPEVLLKKVNSFIYFAMQRFNLSVSKSEGLGESFSESTCLIPLIFILPSHTEPLKLMTEYAKRIGYASKIFTVSLDGEDVEKVEELILHCQKEGSWVLIQNCHLASPATMFFLEKNHENREKSLLLGFRLWLSSYPTSNFPIGILQDGIKITCSAPKDLKHSLLSCYSSDPLNKEEFLASCPGNDKIFCKMIYGLALFHSVLRERTKIKNNGWSVIYDFQPSDFEISAYQLQNLLQKISFTVSGKERRYFIEGISYLVGKCNYGGRIVEQDGEEFVFKVLNNFFNEEIISTRNYCVSDENSEKFVIIPDRCEYRDFLRHIENISEPDDVLEVCGVDESIRKKRDLFLANNFMNCLSLMNKNRNLIY